MRLPLFKRLSLSLRKKFRVLSLRSRFAGVQPCIISCNCFAGFMYHDLGLRFTSPTINLYMKEPEFLSFVENLQHYLSVELVEDCSHGELGYPVGRLDDITVYFMHYKTFAQARQKWNERRTRVDWDNVFVVAQDGELPEPLYDEGLMRRFQALPYEKILFTYRHWDQPHCVYHEALSKKYPGGTIFLFRPDGHRPFDDFDWVGWLNRGRRLGRMRVFWNYVKLLVRLGWR